MKKLLSFVLSALMIVGAVLPAIAGDAAEVAPAEPTVLEALDSLPTAMQDAAKIDIGGADAVAHNAEKYGYTEVSMESATDNSWNGDYWYPASWGKGSIAVIPESASAPKEWAVPVTVDAAGVYRIAVSILNWDKTLAKPDKRARTIDVTVDGKAYRIAESAAIAQGESAYFAITATLAEGLNEVIFTTRTANGGQCYLQDLYYCEKMPDIVNTTALTALPPDMSSATKLPVTDASVIEYNETEYGRVENTDYMYSVYTWTTDEILTTANTWTVPVTIETKGTYKLAFSIRNMYNGNPRMVNVRVGDTIFHLEEDPAVAAGMTLYYTAEVTLAAGTHEIEFIYCGNAAYLKALYYLYVPPVETNVAASGTLPADMADAAMIDLSSDAVVSYNETEYGRENGAEAGKDFNAAYTWGKAKEWTAVTTENTYTVPVTVAEAGTYQFTVSILTITRHVGAPDKSPRKVNVLVGNTLNHIEESAELNANEKAYYTFTATLAEGLNEIDFIHCGSAAYLLDLYYAKYTAPETPEDPDVPPVDPEDPDTPVEPDVPPVDPDTLEKLTGVATMPDALKDHGVIDLGSPAVIAHNEEKYGYKAANPNTATGGEYWAPVWAPDVITLMPESKTDVKCWAAEFTVAEAGTYAIGFSIMNFSRNSGTPDAKPRRMTVTVGENTYYFEESAEIAKNVAAYFTITAELQAGVNEIVFATCAENGLQAYLYDVFFPQVKPTLTATLPDTFKYAFKTDIGGETAVEYNVEKYGYTMADANAANGDYWMPPASWGGGSMVVIPDSASAAKEWAIPVYVSADGTYSFCIAIYNWNKTAASPSSTPRAIEFTAGGITYRLEESADFAKGATLYYTVTAPLTTDVTEVIFSTCTANGLQAYLLDIYYTMTASAPSEGGEGGAGGALIEGVLPMLPDTNEIAEDGVLGQPHVSPIGQAAAPADTVQSAPAASGTAPAPLQPYMPAQTPAAPNKPGNHKGTPPRPGC